MSQIKLKQSSSGAELQRYDYLYGQVTQSNGAVDKSKNNGQIGRIDGVINGSSTKEWEQRFSYDELGRLSTAAEYQQGTGSTPTWKQEFTYDRYGNRFQWGSGNTGVGFTPVVSSDISPSTNRFISTGSTPITYDAAGNITQDKKFRIDPQADGMNYTYDANGRQITAAGTDEIGNQDSVYDCVGQRVQTSGNNVTRQMVYDIFGRLVADYKNGSLERENIYRGGQVLAVYEAASTCYKSIDQFIKDFYQGALGRQPNSTELSDWTRKLTQAQGRGVRALIGVAQDLGNSLFTSTEYTNMNTSDTQFVTDLYEAFLQRSPDTSGLNYWVSVTPVNGRSNVRLAFAVCPEFAQNVTALCPGTSSSTSTSANLKYVLTDLQGSARALMNNSGSGTSTIIARHDYLPFGEEIFEGVGLRTSTQKYSVTDKVRQRFAMTERDEATGLDHTWFRKYDSYSGRWTSPDAVSGSISDPQSLNHYSYVANDPINLIDPLGLHPEHADGPCPPWSPCSVDIYPNQPGQGGGGSGGDDFIPEEPPSDGLPTADPQNPRNQGSNADAIQRDFYSGKYGKAFNECLEEVFGKDAPESQTLANAPALNTEQTSETLKRRSRAETSGTVVGTIEPPKKGKGGAIYISEGTASFYGTNAANDAEALMTYGHELAVLLDYRINPKGKDGKPAGQVYGTPSVIDPFTNRPTDPDTGQAMENCIKRKLGS
ncbi:MAG TPA: DUF4214 domain-containing protein [Pyrinomonadaceae bacterium]|nr:DUF4214 domain-containing protein [Pyrinomonadaceae bacterium]